MKTNVTVFDLEAFSGQTLEWLGEQALERIAKSRTSDISDRWLRKKFGLAADVPPELGLRTKIADNIARYRSRLPEKTIEFRAQTEYCQRLVVERGYLTSAPGFTLVITDDLLHRGLPAHLRCWVPPHNICAFSVEHNAVYVAHTLPNLIVAHEVGHAFSLRQARQQIGLLQLQRRADGQWQRHGSKWLGEGVTVLWEELSVNDGSTLPERHDPDNTYCWYREATRELLRQLTIGQETVLAAYFGNDAARAAVEIHIVQRFGCTLDDLKYVALCQKISFTRRLFNRELVQHTIRTGNVHVRRDGLLITEKPNTELIERWRKLAQIFPNLSLIEPNQ